MRLLTSGPHNACSIASYGSVKRKGLMEMCARMLLMVAALLSLITPAASQDAGSHDSLDAYHRKFSVGVGLAEPYPETSQLYISSFAGEGPLYPYRLEELWRNVFTRDALRGIRYQVFPPRVGYCPSDRVELSIGYWNHRDVWDDGVEGRYAMRMMRLFGNALYRPPIGFSKKFRPVVGLSLAWDEREHQDTPPQGYYMSLFTCATRSGMASVVVGLRMKAGRFLLGLELNAVSLAYIEVEYSDSRGSGELHHWMDPITAFKERYAYGPIILHANYTFGR